jgi:hypothetical protein
MHILHDPSLKDAFNPCGFCLNTGGLCSIRVTKGKGKKGALVVDPLKSRCPNVAKLSITAASKYSDTSPCTNHPLECPLCQEGADLVWKYNLPSHIQKVHPTATLEEYEYLYAVGASERAKLKTLYSAKPRHSKKKKQVIDIKISEAHSSRRALR